MNTSKELNRKVVNLSVCRNRQYTILKIRDKVKVKCIFYERVKLKGGRDCYNFIGFIAIDLYE